MSRRKTYDEFVQEVYEQVGHQYTVNGEYNKNNIPIAMIHNVCGNKYDVSPANFLSSHRRCPKCNGGVFKGHDVFYKEFTKIVGDEYELLSRYIGARKDVTIRHKKCNNVWSVQSGSFLTGGVRCPICMRKESGIKTRKTHDKFMEQFNKVTNDFDVISEYIKAEEDITFKHKLCGCEFSERPWTFLKSPNCPVCDKWGKKNTTEIIKLKLDKEFSGQFILLEEFKRINQDHKIKCLECGKSFNIKLSNLFFFKTCPQCWNLRRKEIFKGDKSVNWQGGITPLFLVMRKTLGDWKHDSMKNCNYKCIVTGNKFDVIHHLYSFNLILKEAIKENNLELKPTIGYYTQSELELLEKTIIKLHNKYPLGVCLSKDIHDLFHLIYGRRKNTSDQFEEFCQRYYSGEFDNNFNNLKEAI